MTSIEPLTEADRGEWIALWNGYLTFYGVDLDAATTEATFQRLVSGDGAVGGSLARNSIGRAVGFVHWLVHPSTWSTRDYCYLEDLFVAPQERSGGVGSALIEYVHIWAAQQGCSKVYWLTAESNDVARSLYDRVATRSGMIQYEIDDL